eukprot:433582_1
MTILLVAYIIYTFFNITNGMFNKIKSDNEKLIDLKHEMQQERQRNAQLSAIISELQSQLQQPNEGDHSINWTDIIYGCIIIVFVEIIGILIGYLIYEKRNCKQRVDDTTTIKKSNNCNSLSIMTPKSTKAPIFNTELLDSENSDSTVCKMCKKSYRSSIYMDILTLE